METAGLPATSHPFPDVVATSGPATGWGSGTVPGHIGTCVCSGDGCQTGVCALRPPNANTTQRAKIKGFITLPTAYCNQPLPEAADRKLSSSLVRPSPVPDFRQIVSAFVNVLLMFDQLVAQQLLEVASDFLQSGNTVH